VSDQSKARAIQRELEWGYQRSLQFVRKHTKEALDMARKDNISGKAAMLIIARKNSDWRHSDREEHDMLEDHE
jgi:hypothetical protein